jgi:hypothetical protein
MQFEHPAKPNDPYRITFEGDEIDVMQGMSVEDIAARYKVGNTGSASAQDLRIAQWPKSTQESNQIESFNSYIDLVEKLTDFSERTDSVVIEIANDPSIADFQKRNMVTRKILGGRAVKLARDIFDAGNKNQKPMPDPDSVDIESEWRNFGDA